MNGLLNVLKPPGMTSHDVVNYVRRALGTKKVGHTGTLDPGAAGVLLICCGKATRLIEYLDHDKQYRAEITFGLTSSTGDAFGQLEEKGVPDGFSYSCVNGILPLFLGQIRQIPPMTSAVRHQGKKLYELARQGKIVERVARTVNIYNLQMVKWYDDLDKPKALFDVSCSAGTYIRTLCQDIGEKLGSGAYMSFLLRTGVGGHSIDSAVTLEELEDIATKGCLSDVIISMEKALSFLPQVEVAEGALKSVGSGAILHTPGIINMSEDIQNGSTVMLMSDGKILGVAMAVINEDERFSFKPRKIIV